MGGFAARLARLLPGETRSALQQIIRRNKFIRPLISQSEVLRGYGLPGNVAAEATEVLSRESAKMSGQSWEPTIRATVLQGLSKADVDNAIWTIHGVENPASPKIAEAARVVSAELKKFKDTAIEAGVEMVIDGERIPFKGISNNYFPIKFTKDALTPGTKANREAAQVLANIGAVKSQAHGLDWLLKRGGVTSERLMGNLQLPRNLTSAQIAQLRPYLRSDLGALEQYYTQAASKIQERLLLGPKAADSDLPVGLRNLLGEIEKQFSYEDKNIAEMIIKSQLAFIDPITDMGKEISGAIAQGVILTTMSLSVIPQMSQPALFSMITGNRTFFNTLFKRLMPGIRNTTTAEAIRSGALMRNIATEMGHTYKFANDSLASKFLRLNRFNQGDYIDRVFAATAGREFLRHDLFPLLSRDPHNATARRLIQRYSGLNPDELLRTGLTQDALDTAAITFSDRVNFRYDPFSLPALFRNSATGRTLFLLKSFAFQQAKLMKDGVVSEVLRGNFTGIGPFLTTVPTAGALVGLARSTITGNEFWKGDLGEFITDAYANVGTLGIVMDAAQAIENEYRTVGFIVGPFGQTLIEAGQSIRQPEVLPENVLKRMPFVGQRLARPFRERRKELKKLERELGIQESQEP